MRNRNSRGVTLVELMIATAIIAIGILGLIGTFAGIQKGIQVTKEKTLANNLAQERVEALKNISYYRLLVTTQTATDNNFNPAMIYDIAPNDVETINVGGISFQRRVHVRKVSENASGNLAAQAWNAADTGLKEVMIYVVWKSGGDWKKVELRNLRDNPDRQVLSASFAGTTRDNATAAALESVTVQAMQNTSRYDASDSAGAYGFSIEPGSYTLRASKLGYFVSYSNTLNATADVPVTQNFNLVKMASGTISGTAYVRDHLVISQVVLASSTQVGDLSTQGVEYVELFNPTTYPINIGVTAGADSYYIDYHDEDDPTVNCPGTDPGETRCNDEFFFIHVTTYVAPGKYYLFANASSFTILGQWIKADAYYPGLPAPNYLDEAEAGAIRLTRASDNALVDVVGWADNESSAPSKEGSQIPDPAGFDGIGTGNQIVRKSSAATTASASYGKAYDSNDNLQDFTYPEHPVFGSGIQLRPYGMIDAAQTVISGTPAAGALVFADDGLSNGAAVSTTGAFALVSVATGSWTVVVSSGLLTQSVGLYGGLADGFSTTTPTMFLTNASSVGYIAGNVETIAGADLANILVEAGGGTDRTDAAGNYLLASTTGTVLVTVNRDGDNPLYVQAESYVTFGLGALATANYALSQGGKITGTVTSNGVDALPNIPVTASVGGVTRGTGVSGATGAFEIPSLSTGSYVVSPQLESGESASPSSTTVSVTAGGTGAAGNFTVTGALGYISGSLTLGSLTGSAITTGVLIYATTSTIASDPPTISSATRSGSSIYYAASSFADGSYEVGVRGGSTYNVYAWYTTWNGDAPTTVRKSATGVSVSAGATVDRDFFW